MSDLKHAPTIGLVLGGGEWSSGAARAALRHVRLLHEHACLLPVMLEDAPSPASWIGQVEASTAFEVPGFSIAAASFRVDEMLGTVGVRARSLADHLLALVARERIDALHLLGVCGGELVAAAVAAQADLPLVVSFLGPDLGARIARKGAEYRVLARAATVCTVPGDAHARLLRRLLPEAANVRVVRAGVDEVLAQGRPPCEPCLAHPVIGCFGEFCRAGGTDILLQAFAHLAAERQGTLLLVGSVRPLESFYYSQVFDHHPFSERIHRVGQVPGEQVQAWMRGCDVIVLPSVQDGFGHVLREAMASGVPIVACDTPLVGEYLHDGAEALVVTGRDAGALSQALARTLDEPASARRMAEACRQAAQARHGVEREREAWLDCYREVGLCL